MHKLSYKKLHFIWLNTLLLFLCFGEVKGQDCTPKTRVYANSQESSPNIWILGTLAEVKNKTNAIDGSLSTYSTLLTNVGLLGLGSSWQILNFPPAELSNDNSLVPVSVKIATGSTILNVLNNITIQATLNNSPVGVAYSGASLLGLLSGQGENIITFTPGAKYNGVSVIINPILDVGTSVDLFYAYFNKPNTTSSNCTTPIEVLTGATGTIASSLTSVVDPTRAIDGLPNSFAKMNLTVSALNETYLTAVYPAQSVIGDFIKIILESDNLALLNASVLGSNFHIRGFNNNTQVFDIPGNSPLLSLNLLNGQTTRYMLTIPITVGFDRLQIAAGGGLATALGGLKIYEIQRILANPKITNPNLTGNDITLCLGNTTTLTVNAVQNCTTYNWYNVAIGGSLLHTGDSYTPNVNLLTAGTHTFYVEAVRAGCTEISERIAVNIIVNKIPSITLGPTPSICIEQHIVPLRFTSSSESPTTYSIIWANGSPLINVVDESLSTNPININIPNSIVAASYSGSLTVKNSNGCTSTPVSFNIVLTPKVTSPILNITSN